MGIPTLLFDRVNWDALTDDARGAYHALEDAGVLYQDASKAASMINEIYPDPSAWWQSDDVQEAVRHYIDQFAYVGEDPIEEWVSFLESLPVQQSE
jgi:putative transferase (TIGR04331 family)